MRQQVGEQPARLRSRCGIARDLQPGRKFHERLTAHAAGRRGFIRVSHDRQMCEISMPTDDRRRQRAAFGATSRRERRVLHVAADDYRMVRSEERGTNTKAGIRGVCVSHCAGRRRAKLLNRVRRYHVVHRATTSGRKDLPAPRKRSSIQSATVAPRSANDARRPIGPGRTRGPTARTGTFSRA